MIETERGDFPTAKKRPRMVWWAVTIGAAAVSIAIVVALIWQNDRRHREEECIRWLKEHGVTGDSFLAFDPLREIDHLEWQPEYLSFFTFADLSNSAIRDEDPHYLEMLPNLKCVTLNTDTTKLSSEGLRELRDHLELQWVNVVGRSEVPTDWVQSLASLPTINFWDFGAPVTDDVLVALDKSRSRVRKLTLSNATGLREKGYQAIGALPDLEAVLLSCRRPLEEKDVRHILRCRGLIKLQLFLLDAALPISTELAEDIASMPKLQEVLLTCPSPPSGKALTALGRRSWKEIVIWCPSLKTKAEQTNQTMGDVTREMIKKAVSDAIGKE